tara:strand:+ start:345 stop:956 length:612 start_codon:yes stop_codon:yes gene_type:complete
MTEWKDSQDDLKRWREDFWEGFPGGKWDRYLRWHMEFLMFIRWAPYPRVLDVGAGYFLASMKRFGLLDAVLARLVVEDGGEYIGLDPEPERVDHPLVGWAPMMGEDLREDWSYHAALIMATLDHCLEPETVLENVGRALSPFGFLFLAQRASHAAGAEPGHTHGWTKKDLLALLERAGFYVAEVQESRVSPGLHFIRAGRWRA